MAAEQVTFGPFVLDSRRGTVLQDGKPIGVSSKGFVLLRVLAEADGRAVMKAELMDAAWPNATVEESNLTVQVAALRKALGPAPSGEEWIATVPRVGYRLIRSPVGDRDAKTPSLHDMTQRLSIAVLPFANMSSDPEQDHFGSGLAEDLITDLSKVPGLMVIARNSSFAYHEKPADAGSVAKELGVRYIVEGSVRRAADRVRINAKLIDTADNSHLWAERFDRDLADVFKLQDEVVGEICRALVGALPSANIAPRQRTANLEAYDLFSRGRLLVTFSEDNKVARPFLQRSIELDPGFAEAHAWLAVSHFFAWTYWAESMEPHRTLASREARQAVLLDPDSAVARGILGQVLVFERKPDEGAKELETALRTNPNHADAWTFFSEYRMLEGYPLEGAETLQKALRLNPNPPGWYYWLLGFGQYQAGKYKESIDTLRHASLTRMGSRRILAASLAQLGRSEEAKLEARQFLAANPHFSSDYWARTQPFRLEADRQHFIDGYLKAGLPR